MLDSAILLLCLAALGAGSLGMRRLLLPAWDGAPARLAEAVVLLGALTLIPTALGAVGALAKWPVAAAFMGFGAAAWLLSRGHHRAETAVVDARQRLPHAASWLAAAVCVVVVAQWSDWAWEGLRSGITDYDSLNYHLTLAARYAQEGTLTFLHPVSPDSPAHLHPLNGELVHAVGMLFHEQGALSVALNHGYLALALLAGWCVGRPFGVAPATLAGIAVVVAAPVMAMTQSGTGGSDIVGLAFLVAAVALLATEHRDIRTQGLAALAAGLAAGSKVTLLAPALLLAAGVIAVTARGRGRVACTWAAGLVAGGSFWYVRNLVLTGSPQPGLEISLGPLSLPSAEFELVERYGFSVAHYWDRPEVWSSMLLPGMNALGEGWPLLVGLAFLGAAGAIACAREPLLRMLGAVSLLSLVAYLVTPTGAIGFEGGPSLFAQNLRYSTPFLAIGLVLLPIVVRRSPAWLRATMAAYGLTALATFASWDWVAWPAGATRALAALGLTAAVAVAGAAAWRRAAASRRPLLAALTLAATVPVIALAAERHTEWRYAGDPVYAWAQGVEGERIAIAGFDRQYPLYGPELSNSVRYVGRELPHGGFTSFGGCRAWRRAVARGEFDFVVTRSELRLITAEGEPREAGWTRTDPAATEIYRSGMSAIFEIGGALSPQLCGRPRPEAGVSSSGRARRAPGSAGS